MIQKRTNQIVLLKKEVFNLQATDYLVSFWKDSNHIYFVRFENSVALKALCFATHRERKTLIDVDIHTLSAEVVKTIYKNRKHIQKEQIFSYIEKKLNRPFFLFSFKNPGFLLPAKYGLKYYKDIIDIWAEKSL